MSHEPKGEPRGGAEVLLAIETSQRQGGIAVRDRAGGTHVERLVAARRHDDDLLPAIDRLFARLGLAPGDLGVVGVSVGPGGFTGLRIAVSTAKMLAEALGARIVAVPSALVAAEAYGGRGPIVVGLSGKNERFWATRLERSGECWQIVGEPGLVDGAEFEPAGLDAVLADQYLPAEARTRCERQGVGVLEPVFDPAACLAEAGRRWRAGDDTDPLQLTPLYPRPPEAVSIWERRKSS